jgi:hypothetical protein
VIIIDRACPLIRQQRKLGTAQIRGDAGWAARRGKQMARNFGMPQHIRPEYRGSLWPVLLIVFIVVLSGAIDIAAHHW